MTTPIPPDLTYVFTITAQIGQPRSAGVAPHGERLHIPIIGGTIRGPALNGHILPGGSDWPVIGPDGNSRIEAHYTIETSDGTLVYVVNKAMRVSSPEVTARLRTKETVDPSEFYMRGAPVFDAPDGPHRWLSQSLFVCTIVPQGPSIGIDVFQLG